MYLRGFGVEKNYIASLMWFLVSEKCSQSDNLLELLDQRMMLDNNNENLFKNEVVSILSPLEILESEKLANNFLRSH